MFQPSSRSTLACLLLAGFNTLTSTHAAAPSESLEEVIVVGSRIPQPQDQALPITIITNEQMEQRGYTTVQQVLDDLSHNSGGGFDQQLNFGYTPSASALNLRDLGVGRSLVLVDGRRVPAFPVGFNGTDSFVDISGIPAGAIDRIEILSDGASAIYGSDAMSGVINVVLKKHVGTEAAVRYGNTVHGGGAEQRFQFSTGAEADGSSAAFFLEYYQREALWYSQRDITKSDRLGGVNGPGPGAFSIYGYPGTFFGLTTGPNPAPGCNAIVSSPGVGTSGFCEFDRAPYRQVWPDSSSVSATAKFEQRLANNINWFTTLRLRDALTKMQTEPIAYNSYFDSGVFTSAGDANNPVGDDGIFYRRLIEFGPQRYDYDVDAYSALTGLQGEFGSSYKWELGLQSARQQVRETAYNRVFNDQMGEALLGLLDLNGDGANDAPLDLFTAIPGYAVTQLGHRTDSVATSTLTSADFQVSGDLWSLPAGAAQFATVAEYVKEIYDDRRDPEIVAGNVTGLGGTSGHGEREHLALGVELSLPLLSTVNLNVASRYDRYNDKSEVGGAFNPRVAIEFRPTSSLLLRASGGLSFRAPDMQRMFGGDVVGFTTLIDTPQCIADGGTGYGDASVPSCVTPIQDVESTTHANIKLKEERGRSFGVGMHWQPTESLSGSIDYFHIRLEDLVNTPDQQYMLDQNALNGSFADAIGRAPGCGDPSNPGCLFFMETQAQNVAYKKTSGLDVAVDYAMNVSGWGRFSVGVTGSYLLDVEMKESIYRPAVDVLRDGQLGESVRLKGGVQLGWQRGALSTNLFVNHVGAFTPLNTALVDRIGSYTTVNASVGYDLPWQAQLQLGVNNLFDRQPPLDLQNGDASLTFYHQQFHDVDGAKWYAGYRQKFGGG